jgi:uncharacterized protein YndB with AHSA1/START domain
MTAAASSGGTASTQVGWQGAELVLTRVFQAPRELVFRAWTDPEHWAQWFGPHGSTLPFCRLDARPGGTLHYQHHFPDYPDVWIRGTYSDVAPPERLAFTCHFSDEAGGRVDRHGFPGEMTIAVAFAEHPDGTEVTIRQTGLVTDQGEVQGWMETLDRLASLLAVSHTHTGADR